MRFYACPCFSRVCKILKVLFCDFLKNIFNFCLRSSRIYVFLRKKKLKHSFITIVPLSMLYILLNAYTSFFFPSVYSLCLCTVERNQILRMRDMLINKALLLLLTNQDQVSNGTAVAEGIKAISQLLSMWEAH